MDTTVGLNFKTIILDNGHARTSERERGEGEIERGGRERLREKTATAKDVRHIISVHDERPLANSWGTRLRIVKHRVCWLQYPLANSKFNTASARGRAGSSEFAHILIETIDDSWRLATWAAHPNNKVPTANTNQQGSSIEV